MQNDHDVLDRFPELGYAFPSLSQLSAVQDQLATVLREQLFGYRANYVRPFITNYGVLERITILTFDKSKTTNTSYTKAFKITETVAECVALMSLGQNQCVPIDRHVFEITKKYFLPELKDSGLTDALNRRLVEFYEEKFGPYAGWAQAVLFNQQLEKFVHSSPVKKPIRQLGSGMKAKTNKGKKILKKTRRKGKASS
ncbi:hypothetical protein NECAME_00672 [Necator americanus]|uniref:HhH-GPD domain-containing protein n=1 Tax=Necator americanus TaxID=51031 RepID=W2T234_NECAM|nr:hypothetical protein NECAME_00672 [Necator americanus]ETN75261.1 hypothetical protein NECAME_00672 [Necator americanus]